jgi:hypothetical protein
VNDCQKGSKSTDETANSNKCAVKASNNTVHTLLMASEIRHRQVVHSPKHHTIAEKTLLKCEIEKFLLNRSLICKQAESEQVEQYINDCLRNGYPRTCNKAQVFY